MNSEESKILGVCDGGLIAEDPGLNLAAGKHAKAMRCRCCLLRDNYTRFYLKNVAPCKMQVEETDIFVVIPSAERSLTK